MKAPMVNLPNQHWHHRWGGTHKGKTMERHVLNEGAESLLHGVEILEMVEVLGIDIGDDGDVGRQLQERTIGFVRLDYHPVTGAKPRIRPIGIDDAAVNHSRIESARIDQ